MNTLGSDAPNHVDLVRTIANFSGTGKKVLVRVDFNVPLDDDFRVTDDTRIREALPTIKKILADGGSAILMSHLGRPKGPGEEFSLEHVVAAVSRLLGTEVQFAYDCIGEEARSKAAALKAGQVLLLENVRFHKEESRGDVSFAEKLATLGDAYVNDAFGTAHRAHASTAVIAQFFPPENRMIGLLMIKEIENANRALRESKKPLTLVLGGAKISDKIMLIRHFLPMADHIIVGGGMTFTFIKALGGSIGNSLLDAEHLEEASSVLKKAETSHTQIHLPVDVVAADKLDEAASTRITSSHEIPDAWIGVDIGPKTIEQFTAVILGSETIVWNGPMGVFEMAPFRSGSEAIARAIASATSKGAYSLVGGGDSVAVLKLLNLKDKMSYVSTGGGAMLEMLEGKELPGIVAVSGE